MCPCLRRFALILFNLPLSVFGQQEVDSLRHNNLNVVVVSGKATTATVGLQTDGSVKLNTGLFDRLPKIMGNADPIRYAQMLPGIQTNSELDTGLHIQGSDDTHNLLSIQGAPVYNATHLLGFFSVFNANHYDAMLLKRSAQSASDAARLGGTLTMQLRDETNDSVLHGDASIGLISSQGTLRIPVGGKSQLVLSGRKSYINLLYAGLLKTEDSRLLYSFYDLNATYSWRPGTRHHVSLDIYNGLDDATMFTAEYDGRLRAKWGNTVIGLHHTYDSPGGYKLQSSVFWSRNGNRVALSQAQSEFCLPSDISTLGYRSQFSAKHWVAGIEASWHNAQPQNPSSQGTAHSKDMSQPRLHAQEYALYADYHLPLSRRWKTVAGLRTSAFVDSDSKTYYAADPSASLIYEDERWKLSANYALRHQYLFRTGTNTVGFPTEFWMPVGQGLRPLWGHNAQLTASLNLWEGRYSMSATGYYKRLYNQVEYEGDIMSFINDNYHLQDHLISGYGYNYGASLMLQKHRGRLTGWVTYSYGCAHRHFVGEKFPGTYPASHERPHEVNCLAVYRLSSRWTLSSTFNYASGTPFTAPVTLYIINGRLLAEYGPYNARRLPDYLRLDVSATYSFSTRHLGRQGVDLSIYNLTCHRNDTSCRLLINDGHYRYSHFALIKFMLPSVSYFIKF